jgi:hypothetical protein
MRYPQLCGGHGQECGSTLRKGPNGISSKTANSGVNGTVSPRTRAWRADCLFVWLSSVDGNAHNQESALTYHYWFKYIALALPAGFPPLSVYNHR